MKSKYSFFLMVLFFILVSGCVTPNKYVTTEQYVKLDNDIVYDKKTGLEWVLNPEKRINWHQAKEWAENLTLNGGRWRLPSMMELKTLFKPSLGSKNITPLLEVEPLRKDVPFFVWSADTKGLKYAYLFLFDEGRKYWQLQQTIYSNYYALAVRFQKN